ncbi:hypothetical protein QJS79_11740, partial [Enterococcus faecium]
PPPPPPPFFFFKQMSAYYMSASLVGSVMCIRYSFNATDNVLSLFTEIKKIVREDLTKEETALKEIKKYLIKQDIQ